MPRASRFGLLPWLGLIPLLRVVLGPSAPRVERELDADPRTLAALCTALGCGCAHEEVETDCCCAADDALAPVAARTAPLAARAAPRAEAASDAGAESRTTITGFRCSGPRHAPAASAPTSGAVLAWTPAASVHPLLVRRACARVEPGPPFDLATEPATPPPRTDERT